MIQSKVKIIIFDLDGVLVDSCDVHFKALNQALVQCGHEDKQISYEEHIEKYNGKSTLVKLRILTNDKGLGENQYDSVWKMKQSITLELIQDYEIDTRVCELLEYLKRERYIIYCASNSIWSTLKTILLKRGFLKYIDYFISNEDVKYSKPHPEMYYRCLQRANVSPNEALIIEDSDIGFTAAKMSGANVLRVLGPHEVTYENIKMKIMSLYKKLNIVIPMAGMGSRFQERGFVLPKPLIEVKGKPMIQWVVDNFNFVHENARFIFITTKEHRKMYNLDSVLSSIAPNCTIIDVESTTEGAACTVLLAKEYINNSDNLIIANSDQYLEWNADDFLFQARCQDVDGMISTFTNTNPKWSYVREDVNTGLICEVAEKNPISNKATTGVYYWKMGCDFVKCAEKMIEKNIRTNNEFYVCPVFNEAIQQQQKIKAFDCKQMWGLGTPDDLQYFLDNYSWTIE